MTKKQTADTESERKNVSFDIVAIAASAGGLKAISEILDKLPSSFAAAIVVVQHLDPRHKSLMADILSRRTKLKVKAAEDRKVLEAGTVYLAPPDHHLLIGKNGIIALTQTELVHFVRPSADLLFESVAASFKERAIAVVLTGTGSDGATGITAIKSMGGTVIAQDKNTSEFFGMPSAAVSTGQVDFILPLEEIAPALIDLVAAGRS
jgi:two-component system chemotaxis response regulator CheB